MLLLLSEVVPAALGALQPLEQLGLVLSALWDVCSCTLGRWQLVLLPSAEPGPHAGLVLLCPLQVVSPWVQGQLHAWGLDFPTHPLWDFSPDISAKHARNEILHICESGEGNGTGERAWSTRNS